MRHIKELLIALAYSELGSLAYTVVCLGIQPDIAEYPFQLLSIIVFAMATVGGCIVLLIKDIHRESDYPALERVVIILGTGCALFSLLVEIWLALLLHINLWFA